MKQGHAAISRPICAIFHPRHLGRTKVLLLSYNPTMRQGDFGSANCITNALLIFSFEIMGERLFDLRLRRSGGVFLTKGGATENYLK